MARCLFLLTVLLRLRVVLFLIVGANILPVIVVCQVRRQVIQCLCCRGSLLIPPDSTIDPLATCTSAVRCKRTPYACSPAMDGSVLIVAVRDCIVAFGSVSAPRPISGVGAPSVRSDGRRL